jgi:hypothetical protein
VDTSARAARLVDSLSALDFPLTGATVDTNGFLRRRAKLDSVSARASPAAPPSPADRPSTGSVPRRAIP